MITDINAFRQKKEQDNRSESSFSASGLDTDLLQLKINLRGQKPPVWRRVLVPQNWNFLGLHHVIRTAFDWPDNPDHIFRFDYNMIWIQPMQKFADDDMFEPEDGMPVPGEINAETEIALSDIFSDFQRGNYLPAGRPALQISILFEKNVKAEPELIYPRCTSLRGHVSSDGTADYTQADIDQINQQLAALLANKNSYTWFNPYDWSLASCLKQLSLTDLRQMALLHKISNASSAGKAGLVSKLKKAIPDRLIAYMTQTEDVSIGQMLILLMMESSYASPFDLEGLFMDRPYDPKVDNEALFLTSAGFVFNLADLNRDLLPEEMRDEPDAYLPLLLMPADIRAKLRDALDNRLFDPLFDALNAAISPAPRGTDPDLQ